MGADTLLALSALGGLVRAVDYLEVYFILDCFPARKVDYPWKPLKCFNCKELGHSTVKCPNHSQTLTQPLKKKKKERKRSLKRLIMLMTGKLCRDLQV